MFKKQNEKMIIEAFDKRAENIGTDIPDVEFSEAYTERKKDIISREGRHPTMTVIIRRAASIAAVVCAVVAVGVAANIVRASKDDSFATKMHQKENEEKPVILTIDDMPEKLSVKIGKDTKELSYIGTSNAGRYNKHSFEDDLGNEYRLNDAGQVNTFWMSSGEKSRLIEEKELSNATVITEKQAQDASVALFKKIYPEFLENSDITYSEYSEELECYEITITKLYGKDNFVDGERLNTHVHKSGVITHWAVGSLEDMDGFDEAYLDGLDRKTVKEYALNYLEAKKTGSTTDCTISRIAVVRVDNDFALRVTAIVEGELEYIYYDL